MIDKQFNHFGGFPMNNKYDYIIYIGRFEPPHKAHIQTIEMADQRADNIIVLIGSAVQPRTIKNPWTWHERASMITQSVSKQIADKLHIYPVRDRLYNDQQWAGQVQEAVDAVISKDERPTEQLKIAIIGYSKDESTYYLSLFPQWDLINTGNIDDIHATDIREAYFSQCTTHHFDQKVGNNLPVGVREFLRTFSVQSEYDNLFEEFEHVQKYKQAWENAPYPPTFVTTDAVVIQSGHVLLVRRRSHPGRGTFALPGGFVGQNERVKDAMIRILREETKIKVPEPVLRGSIQGHDVFDHPKRSLRGRTITHAYHIVLQPGELPKVKGSERTEKAVWIPLSTFSKMEDQLFEDHFHVVNYFT